MWYVQTWTIPNHTPVRSPIIRMTSHKYSIKGHMMSRIKVGEPTAHSKHRLWYAWQTIVNMIPALICHIQPIIAINSSVACLRTNLAERLAVRRLFILALREWLPRKWSMRMPPATTSRRRLLIRTSIRGRSRRLGSSESNDTRDIKVKGRDANFMAAQETR